VLSKVVDASPRKAPATVRLAPENLEAEDILEMVNAGLAKVTIRRNLPHRILETDLHGGWPR
jgi:hypothetical protein